MDKAVEKKTYYETDFISFLRQFEKNKNNEYCIPLQYFDGIKDDCELRWVAHSIYLESKKHSLALLVYKPYNKNDIVIRELDYMNYEFYFKIDYGNREDYLVTAYEINNIVSKDGMVMLCVNNIIYDLAAIFHIATNSKEEKDKIFDYLKTQNTEIFQDKTLDDYLKEMKHRMWNSVTFPSNITKEEFEFLFKMPFVFADEKGMKTIGFDLSKKSYKPKIFISYAWKNKEQVDPIVNDLEEKGLNIWIDKKSIDYGENIYEKMLEGLEECDIGLFFISKGYVESVMAKAELKTVWQEVLHNKKKWKIIKLDDVDPNEIFYSLGNIKYFDLQNDNINDLYHSILKTVGDVKKEKEKVF